MAVRTYPFPRSSRLRSSAEFRAVLGRRAFVAGRHFQVFFRRNGQGDARLGIVAGRKTAGIAARRNFARRLVREAFRLARAGLADADFVVRVTRPLVRGDAATAREELNELLLEASRQCRAC